MKTSYRSAVAELVEWCDRNFLAPNVAKTEADVVVFRRKISCINSLVVKVEEAYASSSGTYISAQ